jgi:hypothetical protein
MKIISLIIATAIGSLIAGPVIMTQTGHEQKEIILTRDDYVVEVVIPTTTMPDLSNVNWDDLRLLNEEEQRITRQMEIDEARMLYGKCGEWKELALAVGWPESEWDTLSYVIHRESRCHIDSHNATDPHSGSRGLMQINGYWCRPNQWTNNGWLQDKGILTTCDDLYNPEINLRAGLAIWQYGEEKHGCGWRGPWATKCR